MRRFLAYLASLLLLTGSAMAQSANIALGSGGFDPTMPVEVTADQFSVDQASGKAVFDGNVLIAQGEMRLSAGTVTIEYAEEGAANAISRLLATGGVTFVTSSDAAEAANAVYSVSQGTVTLSGDVLLTQGRNAIAGDRLVLNLESGNGRMEGRVRTVFTPADGGN
jgi:lipopolysaccharide export system protein LptA